MAIQDTNIATLYIGTNEVAGITSLTQDDPENQARYSDALSDETPALLSVGPPTTGRGLSLEVEVDDEDTTGQIALDAAKISKAKVTGVVFYPYKKLAGNPKYTGDIYVISSGPIGSTGNTNKTRKKSYKLLWAAEPTAGTESA